MLECCSVLVQRNAELCAALAALLAVLGSELTQEDFHKADRVPVLADILQAHSGAALFRRTNVHARGAPQASLQATRFRLTWTCAVAQGTAQLWRPHLHVQRQQPPTMRATSAHA